LKLSDEDIDAITDNDCRNTEFLKKYIAQIDELKDNITAAASEIVSNEIAQLGVAYNVLQDDYNQKMHKMRHFAYVATGLNLFLVAVTVASLVVYRVTK
jgi:hypothetical protein